MSRSPVISHKEAKVPRDDFNMTILKEFEKELREMDGMSEMLRASMIWAGSLSSIMLYCPLQRICGRLIL